MASREPGKNGREERKSTALDRAILSALGEGRTVGREDDPAREAFPELWQWLTQTGDGGDHILQPASISIQLGPEGVLVSLTHRDLAVSLSVACLHLADVLPSLQEALASPNPALRYWGKTEPHLRKKRKS